MALFIALLLCASHGAMAQSSQAVPAQAQVIDQKSFNNMDSVPPATVSNAMSLFILPGLSLASMTDKPFHIYDDEFLAIIGSNPTLTLIADTGEDPLFHEAHVWYKPTDEVFFAQGAGGGLTKSALISKIAVSEAAAVSSQRNATGRVKVVTVDSKPVVMNPNGGTNYKGQLLFGGNGQGNNTAPAIFVMNPRDPYNTTVLLNNYFGRQFNSIDDLVVSPRNGDIYFTDPPYGFLQAFRPLPGLPHDNIYRLDDKTGAVTVVADGFNLPNGIVFSPTGSHAYITDTGVIQVIFGLNYTYPATIYRYDVKEDGTFENRKVFAFVNSGVPDGVHCDTNGNVYAACGDGVHVWNPSGKLIGKIFVGTTSANFQFAGKGRMVIGAETKLFYATLAAEGFFIDADM